MKPISDCTVCVVDNELFQPIAHRLAKDFKRVLYFTEWEKTRKIEDAVPGDGFPDIERCNDYWLVKNEVDLWVFPDVGYVGAQLELESQGRLVWGSRKAAYQETERELFLKTLKRCGLNVPPYEIVVGLTALRKFLEDKEEVYVKISRYRGCFDDATEILTQHGWKLFEHLLPDDRVSTMDLKTRRLEFRVPDAYIKYWYEGEMRAIKGRRIDALVTPNHCFWSKSGLSMREWKYRPLFELEQRGSFLIPQSSRWEGSEISQHTVSNGYDSRHINRTCAGPRTFSGDLWLEFLGWFISEGSLNLAGQGNKYQVTISQLKNANPDHYASIEKCLIALGYNPQREHVKGTNTGFSIYNKSLYLELAKTCYHTDPCVCVKRHCCHRKIVPKYVFESTPRQINIFLDAYGKGDGCNDRGTRKFYTSSKKLADDVQVLISLTGKVGSISYRLRKPSSIRGRLIKSKFVQYCVTQLGLECTTINPHMVSPKSYSGYVYDVTTNPHHSIFVRRNGLTFWSGNSFETSHFRNMKEDEGLLDLWGVRFGPNAKKIRFIVCKTIDTPLELGADTYNVIGKWPSLMLNGIEWKDRSYLCSVTKREDMPQQVQDVLECYGKVLAEKGYRGQFSMEMRLKDDEGWFTDPTCRGGLPSTASQLSLWKNFSEIVYHGAQGELVEPEPMAMFSAESIVNMHGDHNLWRTAQIPNELDGHLLLAGCCMVDDVATFAPDDDETVGWLVNTGDDQAEVIHGMNELADALPDGMDANTECLAYVLKEIRQAAEKGIEFSEEPTPEPATVFEETKP